MELIKNLVKNWASEHISDYINVDYDDDWCMVTDFDDYSFKHDFKEFVKHNDLVDDIDADKFSDYIKDSYCVFSYTYYVAYDAVETEIYYDDLEKVIDEYFSK